VTSGWQASRDGPPGPLPGHWEHWPCLDLVNTIRRDHRVGGRSVDRVRSAVWRQAFLDHWQLQPERAPNPHHVRQLAALRDLLQTLLSDFADLRPPGTERIALLNRLLAEAPRVPELEVSGATFRWRAEPSARPWPWVLAQVAASAGELLVTGDPVRLKSCANLNCGWVFYDESRSRSRRWCIGAICGNLAHVRQFRAQHGRAGV
jgi:predicted RNA-binding Zn ribbon-like protein